MPTITCNQCDAKQVVDDLGGDAVRCKICRHILNPVARTIESNPGTIQSNPGPPRLPSRGEDERPKPRRHAEPPVRRAPRNSRPPVSPLVWGLILGGGGLILMLFLGIGVSVVYALRSRSAAIEPVGGAPLQPPVIRDRFDPMGGNRFQPPDRTVRTLDPAAASADPRQRIRNGDFEQGNKGFRTGYNHLPGDIVSELNYDITTNPREAHRDAVSYNDHTSGQGRMMAINGGSMPDLILWGQNVAVCPDSEYTFSLWISSWTGITPATLDIRINGQSIGQAQAPAIGGQWQEFRVPWRSGAAAEARIEIFNLTTAFSGNDFAIDDISLVGPAANQ